MPAKTKRAAWPGRARTAWCRRWRWARPTTPARWTNGCGRWRAGVRAGRGRRIEGRLAYRGTEGVAGWIGSGGQGKNWMHWWLEALIVRAGDVHASGLALGRSGKDAPLPWRPRLPSAIAAKVMLDELLD